MHTSTNAHRAYLYHPDAEAVCDARGNSALENKMTFLIPRRVHRTPPVQSRSIGRHGSIHVYPGDDCACDFIDDEPTRHDATRRDDEASCRRSGGRHTRLRLAFETRRDAVKRRRANKT